MPHENLYNLTLDQQIETAQRIRHDVDLQRAGAVALENGRLEVTREQYDTAHAEMASALAKKTRMAKTLQPGQDKRSAETATNITEKFLGIVARSGVTVATYTSNDVIKGTRYGWTYLRSSTMIEGDEVRFKDTLTTDLPLVELNAQGVSEVVTFSQIADSPLLDRVPGHQNEKGDVTCVSYESTDAATRLLSGLGYSDRAQYSQKVRRYPTGFEKGAPGVDFSYHLFMAPQDAAELRAIITDQPEALHLLNEMIMVNTFGADPEGLRSHGPQYDTWREADGGRLKLAIRNNLEEPAVQSQIITY